MNHETYHISPTKKIFDSATRVKQGIFDELIKQDLKLTDKRVENSEFTQRRRRQQLRQHQQ